MSMNVSNSSVIDNTLVGDLVTSSVLGLCFVLGVPGNLGVLVMLVQHLKEDSITPKLMTSLAVSDLLSLLTLPVWIYGILNGWVFGQALCKLLSYEVYWSLYSSVLCVTLMSVQRYLQVLYPRRWANLGRKGQNGLICGIWAIGAILASYSLFNRRVGKVKKFLQCFTVYRNNQEKIAVLLIETLLMFFVPFSCLLCFYLRLHQRVNQSFSLSSHRLTKLAVRIVVTFFIFTTPRVINNLVQAAVTFNLDISANITGALFFINSCVNPFLYAFSARTWRSRDRQDSNQPQAYQNQT